MINEINDKKLVVLQFIKNAYCPCVGLLCSPDVEIICQKNHLTFAELIAPFSQLSVDVIIKDPLSTQSQTIKNFLVDIRDLRQEGLSLPSYLPTLLSDVVHDLSIFDQAECFTDSKLLLAEKTPWYNEYCVKFFQHFDAGDHEFLKHYIACILVVSTSCLDPLEELAKLSQLQHAQQHQLTQVLASSLVLPRHVSAPKWFLPNIFKYHVLLHDVSNGDEQKAESVYQSMKMTYGAHACHLLRINSSCPAETSNSPDPWSSLLKQRYRGLQNVKFYKSLPDGLIPNGTYNDGNDYPKEIPVVTMVDGELEVSVGQSQSAAVLRSDSWHEESIPHPLSDEDLSRIPDELNYVIERRSKSFIKQTANSRHGGCLSASDIDRIKIFVQEFCTRGLLPSVERQMRILHEQMTNRRNFQKSLISATKKWFGSTGNLPNPTGTTAPAQQVPNSVVYTSESAELQVRRLADMAFLFQNYSLAYGLYHSLKTDFANDQAWLYCSSAMEMASLCIFMQGNNAGRVYPHHYMETALTTYMFTCGKPLLAARACILSTEILRSLDKHSEAADQFIRMTSAESDLLSALFLEQASRCFLQTGLIRKLALHFILAGHRFSKAGHRRHALRCYRVAYEIYKGKGWRLAEDHINFTIGHHTTFLRQTTDAVAAYRELVLPYSSQSYGQQIQFVREYLTAIKLLSDEDPSNVCNLPLPMIRLKKTKVYLGDIAAESVQFELDPQTASTSNEWTACEKCAWLRSAHKSAFKSTVNVLSEDTDNTYVSDSPINEKISIDLCIENPVNVGLVIRNLHLIWKFESNCEKQRLITNDNLSVDQVKRISNLIQTEITPDFILYPLQQTIVRLSLLPFKEGRLNILGISYEIGLALPLNTSNTAFLSNCGTEADDSNSTNFASEQQRWETLVPDLTLLVRGRQLIQLQGKRLNSTKFERMNQVYGSDYRLEINVSYELPKLKICTSTLPQVMYCGETVSTIVTIENIGKMPINRLLAVTPHPDSILLSEINSNLNIQSYCWSSDKYIPASNEQQQPKSHYVIFDLLSTNSLAQTTHRTLHPGETIQCYLWLRAPDAPNQIHVTVKMIWYYETDSKIIASGKRHRAVRWCHQLSTKSCLSLQAKLLIPVGQHNLSSVVCVSAENSCEVSNTSSTDIEIMQLCCLSKKHRFDTLLSSHASGMRIGVEECDRACVSLIKRDHSLVASALSSLSMRVSTSGDCDWSNGLETTSCLQVWPNLLNDTSQPDLEYIIAVWKADTIAEDGSVCTCNGQLWLKSDLTGHS